MHQRIRFSEDRRYGRIVARIPAGLERACRRLGQSEGWELGDLYRCLIVLGACGSYLTLRPSEARELLSDSDFAGVVDRYFGGRLYAPRTGRRSRIVAVSLPASVSRSLALYAKLTGKLRSHAYTRLLQAGLLIYVRSEERLADRVEATGTSASADPNHG